MYKKIPLGVGAYNAKLSSAKINIFYYHLFRTSLDLWSPDHDRLHLARGGGLYVL